MRLRVDKDSCQGHNRCYAAYPEIFGLDEGAKAFVRNEEIPPEWEDRARAAVENCPERAILIDP